MGVDLETTIDDDLQEIDQGDWVGRNRAEMYNQATLDEIKRLGKDFKALNGESMNEGGDRAFGWMDRAIDINEAITDSERFFVFTHGLVTRCLASKVHDWSHAKTFEKSTDNTSYTLFVPREGKWQLEYLGRKPE